MRDRCVRLLGIKPIEYVRKKLLTCAASNTKLSNYVLHAMLYCKLL